MSIFIQVTHGMELQIKEVQRICGKQDNKWQAMYHNMARFNKNEVEDIITYLNKKKERKAH